MATSVVFPRVQFFANNGRPLIGGRIHTYVAGSSTRAPTYKDSARAQPNTNPIILDGRGEASIYLDIGVEYKFVVEDSKGELLLTQEPVYGAIWPNAEDWPSDATLAYQYMLEAKAAAGAIGPLKFYDTYAQAMGDIANIPNDGLVEISRDETRDGARTRYFKRTGGVLEFAVNLDQLRIDLKGQEGSNRVGFIQSGVGAVSSTAEKELRRIVSAEQFGAIGDGSTDATDAFQAAGVRSPGGFSAGGGEFRLSGSVSAPVFVNKETYIINDTGLPITANNKFVDMSRLEPVFGSHIPRLYGRRANQIFQLAPPDSGVSGVSQALMIDEETGSYYVTWHVGGDNVLVRKINSAGATLLEFTLSGVGHGDSFSPCMFNGSRAYLMGGGGPSGGKVFVIQDDAIVHTVDVNLLGRIGGASIAVDQCTGDKCAFFYRAANSEWRIAHSIPLADVLAGTAVSEKKNTFTFTLPQDPNGSQVNMQSLAYFNGDILVWSGNDSRSGQKLLIRFDRFGQLIEQMDVRVDQEYANAEGTITEPEGMSVSRNPVTGECDIHLTKCFGSHLGGTIIRVYELAGGASDNAVFVEGMPERDNPGGPHQLRIVDIPIIFEKVSGGWTPNVGSVLASTGKMGANNVRVDVGGLSGLFFDLYKPYISLVGVTLTQSAGLTGKRIFASWTLNKGGSTSNKDHRITFFDVNSNAFVSGNDAAIANGTYVCITLRVGYHR